MSKKRTRKDKGKVPGELDAARWTHASFAVGAFISIWFMTHLVDDVWASIQSFRPDLPPPMQAWTTTGGVILGLAIAIWAWRKEEYFKFVSESVIEVSQIVWPTRSETRAATIVVITITLISSGLLWTMDLFWATVTDRLYNL